MCTIERNGQIFELTYEEIEQIYRYKERQYLLEDAERHLRNYAGAGEDESDRDLLVAKTAFCEKYGIELDAACDECSNDFLLDTILEKYHDEHDCNCAENDLWDNIIEAVLAELFKSKHEEVSKYVLSALLPHEEAYAQYQSQQLRMQTGFIGCMKADFGSDGNGFCSVWYEYNRKLKTPEFAAEFDSIINNLRGDKRMLHDRTSLNRLCGSNYRWATSDERGCYGVRIDTLGYSYLLRLTPSEKEHTVICYCYKRDFLDRHIQNAKKGIRFIDPNYAELFVISDGDAIRFTNPDGITADVTCRYIDDYHLEVGNQLYHICQFAELMQASGNRVAPLHPESKNCESAKKS